MQNYNTDIVLICRLIFKEYGPYIEYIKGKKHSSRRTINIPLKQESRDYTEVHLSNGNSVRN